jgi:hypothetical protein
MKKVLVVLALLFNTQVAAAFTIATGTTGEPVFGECRTLTRKEKDHIANL